MRGCRSGRYLLTVCVSPQSALDWWPRIDAVYCHAMELRSMFSETLHKAIQGCGAHPAIRMTPVSLRASAHAACGPLPPLSFVLKETSKI